MPAISADCDVSTAVARSCLNDWLSTWTRATASRRVASLDRSPWASSARMLAKSDEAARA